MTRMICFCPLQHYAGGRKKKLWCCQIFVSHRLSFRVSWNQLQDIKEWFYNRSGEPLREEFHRLKTNRSFFLEVLKTLEAFCLTLSFVKSQITPITQIPCSHQSWKRSDRLCIFPFFFFYTDVSSDFANVIQLLLDVWEACVRLLRRQKTGTYII